MKSALCLVLLALVASSMATSYVYYTVSVPVDRRPVPVSEALLALQSGSSLLSSGNGMYTPVDIVQAPVSSPSKPLPPSSRLVELV